MHTCIAGSHSHALLLLLSSSSSLSGNSRRGRKPILIGAFISLLGANDMTGPGSKSRYGNKTWNTTFHLPVDRDLDSARGYTADATRLAVSRGNHIDAKIDQIRRSDLPYKYTCVAHMLSHYRIEVTWLSRDRVCDVIWQPVLWFCIASFRREQCYEECKLEWQPGRIWVQ